MVWLDYEQDLLSEVLKYISLMNKFRPMYEINSISCLAMEFFLKNSFLVKKHIKNIQRSKNFLIKELSKIKY